MNVGETLELGPYTIRCWIRPDNPAFPSFLIFRRGKLVGKQLSMPCLTDCQWHEQRQGEYAKAEESQDWRRYRYNNRQLKNRGRLAKAESTALTEDLEEASV